MGEGDDFMRGLERSEREREGLVKAVSNNLLMSRPVFRAAHEGNAAVKKWFETSSRL